MRGMYVGMCVHTYLHTWIERVGFKDEVNESEGRRRLVRESRREMRFHHAPHLEPESILYTDPVLPRPYN